jgi:hypothetical protein
MLAFWIERCYNAQANFVGTLVLCPFLESFIYRYGKPVMPFSMGFGIRCVSGKKQKTDYEGKENYCESKIISKTDLRKMQDHQKKRQYQSNL